MAALANPPGANYSYVDRLSFMFSLKPLVLKQKHSLLPNEFDLNPSFVFDKILFVYAEPLLI